MFDFLHQLSLGSVASQTPWAMEYGQCVINVAAYAHLGFHKVAAMTLRRDLQLDGPERHAVVMADDALELLAQDLGQVRAARHERGAELLGRLLELQIKGRPVVPVQILIGGGRLSRLR
jgi:hypothetical protein